MDSVHVSLIQGSYDSETCLRGVHGESGICHWLSGAHYSHPTKRGKSLFLFFLPVCELLLKGHLKMNGKDGEPVLPNVLLGLPTERRM